MLNAPCSAYKLSVTTLARCQNCYAKALHSDVSFRFRSVTQLPKCVTRHNSPNIYVSYELLQAVMMLVRFYWFPALAALVSILATYMLKVYITRNFSPSPVLEGLSIIPQKQPLL